MLNLIAWLLFALPLLVMIGVTINQILRVTSAWPPYARRDKGRLTPIFSKKASGVTKASGAPARGMAFDPSRMMAMDAEIANKLLSKLVQTRSSKPSVFDAAQIKL